MLTHMLLDDLSGRASGKVEAEEEADLAIEAKSQDPGKMAWQQIVRS